MKTNEKIFNHLKETISEEKFKHIKDKVRSYLTIYSGTEFKSFSITVVDGRIESIKFFNDNEDTYRIMRFDSYHDVSSIEHYENNKKVGVAISSKLIEEINGESSESHIFKRRAWVIGIKFSNLIIRIIWQYFHRDEMNQLHIIYHKQDMNQISTIIQEYDMNQIP